MTRKSSEVRKPKEAMFLGDSRELKKYLFNKRKFFKQLLKDEKSKLSVEQVGKISGFIESIDEMLDQKYFFGKRVYSMSDLINEIKLERDELLHEMEVMKLEVDKAKRLAEEAFKAENSYLANEYEEIYNTSGQIELRRLIDEYQVLSFQYEGLERCKKALWWLLGVIHRPIGFFEKVV